jgi:SAM-dependent methyltransferase
MPEIHHAARVGFSAKADIYAAGRPDYPAGVKDWLRDALNLGDGARAIDLGAGTGKFLPYLVGTGAAVTAIEPIEAMRAELVARHPGVTALEGSAEAIPLPDGAFDAVVCAQAFHWFATPRSLAEIRRVLKPGGHLGLVWNARDETVPFIAAMGDIMAPYVDDAPAYKTGAWRAVFPAEGFGPLVETRFVHAHVGPPERVVIDRVLSVSYIAALAADERARVKEKLEALIAGTPELAGKSAVTVPYITQAFVCRRLG